MENVPDDVLIAIAAQLKRNASAAQDLLTFIKVSARWHALGIPLLYGNISISTRRIELFAHGFVSSKYAKLVRSLSLRVGTDDSVLDRDPFRPQDSADPWNEAHLNEYAGNDPWEARRYGSWIKGGPTHKQLEARLPFALFVPILSKLRNLVSFSLVIEGGVVWYTLRQTTMAGLVNALPPSCINLELDTNGYDYMDGESVHVCDAIRRILPRMRNVRLRLGAMCSALFGSCQSPISIKAHERSSNVSANWVTLKNMESLVVSCGNATQGDLLLRCGYGDGSRHEIGSDSWCDITSGLIDLVATDVVGSRNTQIIVMSPSWGDEQEFTFETQLRTDIVNRETWAVPLIHKTERFSFPDYNLIRAPDGSEQVIKNYDQINDISEGHIWRSTACGARLPAYVVNAEKKGLASFATGCVERQAPNLKEQYYDDVRPGMFLTRTYRDEAQTGVKLVLAEKRTGHDFLALRPVKVLTPDGWVRTGRDQILERINRGLH